MSRPVAVVTGGGRGIGRGISVALANLGYDLVIGWNRGKDDVAETMALVEGVGGRALESGGDISDEGTSQELADLANREFGRLDAWVNNAGVIKVSPLLETSSEDVEQVWRINFLGTFHGIRSAARSMLASKTAGRIVNISSEAGIRAWPLYAAYAPTKFAVNGLTQVAALELAPSGICVNAVCPGIVETDMMRDKWPIEAEITGRSVEEIRQECTAMVPTGHLSTPEDIGSTVAWLVGSGMGNVTGQAICVNGGVTLH